MPSKSKSQMRFMQMLAHNPELAKAKGVPVEVAKEYVEADKKAKTKNKQNLPEHVSKAK